MKTNYFLFIIGCIILAFTFSCNNDDTTKNVKTLIVASQQKSCTGVGTQLCYLVKEKENLSWEYFYDTIEGFTYKTGYEYVIKVEVITIKNPPADGSSLAYRLIEIISKKQKNSDI